MSAFIGHCVRIWGSRAGLRTIWGIFNNIQTSNKPRNFWESAMNMNGRANRGPASEFLIMMIQRWTATDTEQFSTPTLKFHGFEWLVCLQFPPIPIANSFDNLKQLWAQGRISDYATDFDPRFEAYNPWFRKQYPWFSTGFCRTPDFEQIPEDGAHHWSESGGVGSELIRAQFLQRVWEIFSMAIQRSIDDAVVFC